MAKQTWNNPIDKNVDWGGDASTNHLPVSGDMVQKFIKDSLNGKAGIFYYDTSNNRYLVFADAEARDEFLLDPTQTELVIGTFDAPFNFSAEINLTSSAYNAVQLGSTGNYIDFTFDVKNKQGNSTGENVTITYTFIRNATKQVVSETKKFGDVVHFNIDKYLGEGTNTIMVGIVGQTSLAATTVAITYQVVNLTFEDSLDISKVYNLTSGSQRLDVPFTVSGYGTKVVEWYLDGVEIPFVKEEDEVVDVIATRTKYITLSNLQQGVHTLQMRAYTVVNGEKFYTKTLYREFFVYTGANSDLMLAVAIDIPNTHGIVPADGSVTIYDMVQYVPYALRFATYSPTNAANTEVTISFDGVVKGSVNTVNGTEIEYAVTSTTSGAKVLNLSTATLSRDIPVEVALTTMDIHEINTALALDFNGVGKSNNSLDKDFWTFGDYTATFEGFEWNAKSGWNNGRLEMSAGTSFGINYAPLAGKPTNTGKTIEIEWSTKNVFNDDAVICDLRGDNGAGILITATKVSLTSVNGVTIETEYKSDENVRVAFVINQASGVTNQHLSFIYANGILSRGETWAATDSYTSDKEILFTASADAEVSLKAIRIYDAALTSDNILNNHILYRDTVAEMMTIYDRNDVYENNTVTFSPEKMMGRLPVMIVTGDIPTLENTSDKDTQIVVDIEYHNMQDVSKSFTMKNAAMRPQGTSSMGYPKKNFRIYTQKVANTKLYDSNGKEVADKLYSFKQGAQPVDCWCLKADYAESSGTHNTGIARLWNEALFNAQIDGEYKLRTEAQKKAVEAGYPYDVRTTIDGFPILLFYRKDEDSDLIFIGKYNFNNDKSTESVFGFEGVPNFDNSKMQCWEVLNNGNALALFTNANGFDTGWSEAFESRYPDTKTPYTGDLKAFCNWMVAVTPTEFVTEKWEHLDVYKMAAYWCYLMRHAAADQFVKNAMFTSEDGVKWYYILYDNDTINGLINTGDIRIKPTDDRQTKDASGSYVFAGHNSKLWNFLEKDEEFQEIVSKVDNALYSAGISYANTIKVFDEEQADKWVERVYNQDAQYKYVGPYAEKGINNLFMLQGKRDLHRRWWLAKRFSIYDAKYVSGTYKSEAVEIKCLNGTEAGQQFSIVAGYPLDYGYGINNVPRAKGITLNVGESHTFTTEEVVNVGDPIRIYGAPNIAGLDLSAMTDRIVTLNVASANSETLGTKMTKLVVGNANANNLELKEISGLKGLASLEYLDIQGLKAYTSIDLTNQPYLKTLKAFGSNIVTATFAKGAPITSLELPTALKTLELNELPNLTKDGLAFESGMNGISSISIKGCPKLSKDFAWVYNWYVNKTTPNETSSLVMDNVDWKDVNAEQLAELTNLGNIQLKGKVTVTDITLEQLNMLINAFGESAFDKNAELFINAPDAIFVTGRTELLEGESEDYACIVFGADVESLSWSIYSGSAGSSYTTIDGSTGLLTTKEGTGARTLVIRVVARTSAGTKSVDTSVSVKARTYPASDTTTLTGSRRLNNTREVYKLEVTTPNVNGEYVVTWSLSGMDGYAEIESSSNTQCIIKKLQEATTVVNGTLTAAVKKKANNSSLFSKTLAIELVNDTIAEIDTGIVTALYNAGLCANSTYITKEEAALITDVDLQPGTSYSNSIFYSQKSNIKSFDGFQFFTGVTKVPTYLFYQCSNLKSIKFPSNAMVIEPYSVFGLGASKITLPEGVVEIKEWGLGGTSALKELEIPSTLTNINVGGITVRYSSSYYGVMNTNLHITVSGDNPIYKSVNGILYTKDGGLFYYSKSAVEKEYIVPDWVTYINSGAFAYMSMDYLSCPNMLSTLAAPSELKRCYIYGTDAGLNSLSVTEELTLGAGQTSNGISGLFFQTSNNSRKHGTIEFSIDANNPHIKSDGTCVFNKEGTTLIMCHKDTVENYVVPIGVSYIESYAFSVVYGNSIEFPEGMETLGSSSGNGIPFSYCKIDKAILPSTLKKLNNYALYQYNGIETLVCKAITPPSVMSYGLGISSNSTTGEKQIIIPFGTKSAYKAANGWKDISGYDFVEAYNPTECVSLTITANDVSGRAKTTKVQYTALTNGVSLFTGERIEGVEITGEGISSEFPQNTSYTDTVEREVSFTYLGVTATTTITQGVWFDANYTLDLNEGQWELTTAIANPDSTIYDGVYQSVKSKGVNSGYDTMYIDLVGYESFKLYIRSYAESNYDYVMVSQLDQTINGSTSYSNTTLVKAHTRGNQQSGTAISNYTLVEFTGIDGGEHRITVVYRKDSSGNNDDDRGYVLIPKEQ